MSAPAEPPVPSRRRWRMPPDCSKRSPPSRPRRRRNSQGHPQSSSGHAAARRRAPRDGRYRRRAGAARAAGAGTTRTGRRRTTSWVSRSVRKGRAIGHRRAAARGRAEARHAGGLARAGRPPHRHRRREGADAAYAQHIKHSVRDPRLMEAAVHLCEGRIALAEALLREHLKQHPTDVAAIRMLAEVAARLGRYGDCRRTCSSAASSSPRASRPRATTTRSCCIASTRSARRWRRSIGARHRAAQSRLSQPEGRHPGRIGEYEQSIELYAEVLAEYPKQPRSG